MKGDQLPGEHHVLRYVKPTLIDGDRHTIIESAHPSPLSAHNGFFGSRPFSKTNDALVAAGLAPIDWQLSADPELNA